MKDLQLELLNGALDILPVSYLNGTTLKKAYDKEGVKELTLEERATLIHKLTQALVEKKLSLDKKKAITINDCLEDITISIIFSDDKTVLFHQLEKLEKCPMTAKHWCSLVSFFSTDTAIDIVDYVAANCDEEKFKSLCRETQLLSRVISQLSGRDEVMIGDIYKRWRALINKIKANLDIGQFQEQMIVSINNSSATGADQLRNHPLILPLVQEFIHNAANRPNDLSQIQKRIEFKVVHFVKEMRSYSIEKASKLLDRMLQTPLLERRYAYPEAELRRIANINIGSLDHFLLYYERFLVGKQESFRWAPAFYNDWKEILDDLLHKELVVDSSPKSSGQADASNAQEIQAAPERGEGSENLVDSSSSDSEKIEISKLQQKLKRLSARKNPITDPSSTLLRA